MKEELYKNIITLRLTDKQLDRLKNCADELDVSMSDVIREQLVVYLDQQIVSV